MPNLTELHNFFTRILMSLYGSKYPIEYEGKVYSYRFRNVSILRY